jgi:hypothetical protein
LYISLRADCQWLIYQAATDVFRRQLDPEWIGLKPENLPETIVENLRRNIDRF